MPDERTESDLAAIKVIHLRYEHEYAAYVAFLGARDKSGVKTASRRRDGK
jgi:hypothetical protein